MADWAPPSGSKRARSPVEKLADLHMQEDDDEDNWRTSKRYFTESSTCSTISSQSTVMRQQTMWNIGINRFLMLQAVGCWQEIVSSRTTGINHGQLAAQMRRDSRGTRRSCAAVSTTPAHILHMAS
eukprot:gene12687-12818_t